MRQNGPTQARQRMTRRPAVRRKGMIIGYAPLTEGPRADCARLLLGRDPPLPSEFGKPCPLQRTAEGRHGHEKQRRPASPAAGKLAAGSDHGRMIGGNGGNISEVDGWAHNSSADTA